MAGNPFINSIAKQNRQGDPRFGRFGAGGSSSQGQYQAQPNYSSEPQQYGQQAYEDGSIKTGVLTSKPPTYPTQVGSQSNAKLQ